HTSRTLATPGLLTPELVKWAHEPNDVGRNCGPELGAQWLSGIVAKPRQDLQQALRAVFVAGRRPGCVQRGPLPGAVRIRLPSLPESALRCRTGVVTLTLLEAKVVLWLVPTALGC